MDTQKSYHPSESGITAQPGQEAVRPRACLRLLHSRATTRASKGSLVCQPCAAIDSRSVTNTCQHTTGLKQLLAGGALAASLVQARFAVQTTDSWDTPHTSGSGGSCPGRHESSACAGTLPAHGGQSDSRTPCAQRSLKLQAPGWQLTDQVHVASFRLIRAVASEAAAHGSWRSSWAWLEECRQRSLEVAAVVCTAVLHVPRGRLPAGSFCGAL